MKTNHADINTGASRPDDPASILDRKDWSENQKVAYLQDWRLDLTERMTAEDENMSARRDDGHLAEQLQRVSTALARLEQSGNG